MTKSTTPTIAVWDESTAPTNRLQIAEAKPDRAFTQASMWGVEAPRSPYRSGASKRRTGGPRKIVVQPAFHKDDAPTETEDDYLPSVSRKTRTRYKRIDNLRLSDILQVLDSLNLEPLISAIRKPYTTGRRGYDVCALLRAHLARYVLDVEYVTDWVEDLQTNPTLAAICGLDKTIPSEATFSRFNAAMAKHADLTLTLIHDLVNAIKERVDQLHAQDPAKYPEFAKTVAIDATAIRAYSQPKRHPDAKKKATKKKRRRIGDKDAEWGMRHKANSYGEMVWYYGYKAHIISDANYEVPIAITTTTAKSNDGKLLRPLSQQAKAKFNWYAPDYLLADKGYDDQDLHRYLRSKGTAAVIAIRKPTARDGMYDGFFNADGDPTCMGMVGMQYVSTDPTTKYQLWKCRPEGCHLQYSGTKAITHCDTAEWLDPDDNPRLLTDIPRNSKRWKRLYRKRWSVERVFSSLKHSRLLENHCYRGAKKVESHVNVSVLSFLATILTHLNQDDADHMSWMKVRRA